MKFRKKPVVIDAFQMTEARRMDNSDWPNWLNSAWNEERDQEGSLQRADMTAVLPDMLEIVTLEGNHKVSWGDYIIRGVQGELYPCKPEIFVATYEPVGYIDPAEVLEAASMWKGPGETPHRYSPDYMAQGDCRVCGHHREAHQSAPDAVARLWHAARLGLDMARANDLTNTAETIMEAMNAVECPCKGSDEMCPCQNRRTAPDAVARLVEAATVLGPWISASLSDPHTHAGEDYTRDADAFLVALAAMEASHDRT